jgi:hypothetical protein
MVFKNTNEEIVFGWKYFEKLYKSLVDYWLQYDNSGSNPILIDAGGKI